MTFPSLTQQPGFAAASRIREFWVPVLLFALTLVSTTAVGVRYMHNFRLGLGPVNGESDILPYGWCLRHLDAFPSGLPFSVTLLLILLAHEFGHYAACRRFGVRATLPYLLPAPSLSGTFGAVIRLRSRVHSRAALLAIGAAGPMAGFALAVLAAGLGLACSASAPEPVAQAVRSPLLITGMYSLLQHLGASLPPASHLVPHPVLVASWIGLLITALNLLPAGQLDGGHILYAVSPRVHRVFSRLMVLVLAAMGVFCWGGWLLWAGILLLPAMRHPAVRGAEAPDRWLYAAVPCCAGILLLSATPQPFEGFSLLELFQQLW